MDMADGAMDNMDNPIPVQAPDDISVYTNIQAFQMDHSPGHVPPYNEEHLDFYFYIQNDEVRYANITAGTEPAICGKEVSPDTYCRGQIPFPKECCPPLYLNIAAVVPKMGAHLIDLLSPELQKPDSPNYHPWTIQMTYGAFKGRITFWEPMMPFRHLREALNGTNIT